MALLIVPSVAVLERTWTSGGYYRLLRVLKKRLFIGSLINIEIIFSLFIHLVVSSVHTNENTCEIYQSLKYFEHLLLLVICVWLLLVLRVVNSLTNFSFIECKWMV